MVAAAALLGLGGSVLWLVAVVLWFVTRKAMREFASLRLRALPGGSSRVLCLVGAAYFAGLVALRLASPLVGRLLSQLGGGDGAPAARAVASALFALLALVPPAAVLLVHGRPLGLRLGDLGVTKFRPLRDLPAGLVGYAAVVPFLAVSLAASAALFEPSSSRINPAVLEFAMSKGLVHRLTLFALGAVIAPLVEEFMFRGVLLRALQPALGFVGSVVLTSAVFAMLHPQLPMGFLSIFVLGVGFSILYGLTGSLWPSVLAHAINNGLVLGYLALYLGG
jgi:membrane protease YdiL (CAAX protease family)